MKVEDFKKRNTLNVPEGYFEALQTKVASKTCRDNAVAAKRERHLGWRSIAYAASIAAVALIGEFLYNSNALHGYDLTASEEYYDKEYIENILVNYPIDDYTFYCYLTDTDMN